MNNTMTNPSGIERVVMRRVRLMRILLLVVSTATLAVLAGVAGLWGIGKEVWVAKVFENGPDGFFDHLAYLGYAFLHTELLVQALCVLTFASLVFLVREVVAYLFPASAAPCG